VELALLAVWCFVVALAGGVVGLVLGNIRLPVVLLLASTPAVAGGTNIAISGVAAATAAIVHVRAGRVDWRMVAWMAPPSAVGAVAGGYLAGRLDESLLLIVIAVVLLYSGTDLLRRRPARPPPPPEASSAREPVGPAIVAGLVIGVLGGLVGLILGSLRMPALLRIVGMPARRAVGTNLVVGVVVGIAGTIGHLPDAAPDADLLLIGAAASIPGALLGARLTGRLGDVQLVRAIGAVLLVAGAVTLVEGLA
jgi:uncharacterized membrane protein YfcA